MQNVSLDIILPAVYIPGDVALLPIWITSGSCFALIHAGTNDVPSAPSRSRAPAILSTMLRRRRCFACIYLRFISSRCRSTRTDRKFLNIGWKRYSNLIRKFTVLGERRALPGPTLFPLFSLAQDLRWFTVSDGNGVTWQERRHSQKFICARKKL